MNIESLAGVAFTAAAYTAASAVLPDATFDYQGVAILLGAVTVFITGIVTSILTVMTFNRQSARDQLMQVTHDLVDGLAKTKEVAIERAAFAEGKEAGVDKERAEPMAPVLPPTP